MPGVEWFSVIEIDKKIVSIGSILAQTKNPKTPLDIVTYFKKDPEVILLYTDNIPFELKINSNQLKEIVSMVSSGPIKDKPNFVIHHIKKISSSQDSEKIFKWFESVSSSSLLEHGSKWFFIDEINNDWRNVIIFGIDPDTYKVYGENFIWSEFGKFWMTSGFTLKKEDLKINTYTLPYSEYKMDYQQKLDFANINYEVARTLAQEERMHPAEIKKMEQTLPYRHEIKKYADEKHAEKK